ncbi:hypothetical protein LINPERHAP2_LOCUS41459 [Linum perenne]
MPVRRNGRLKLTKVRIDMPKVLRAMSEDGQLRLLLFWGKIKIDGCYDIEK